MTLRMDRTKWTGRGTLKPGKMIGFWAWDTPKDPTLARLARAYFKSLEAVDSVAERRRHAEGQRAELKRSGRFTDAGIDEEIRRMMGDPVSASLPLLRKAQVELAEARAEIEARRAKAAPKGRPAATPQEAVERMELRNFLRAMPDAKRQQLLMGKDCDQRYIDAVLDAPPELSGASGTALMAIRSRIGQRDNGEELTALDDLDDAYRTAERATIEALKDLEAEVGAEEIKRIEAA